jgi:hypothetical protein
MQQGGKYYFDESPPAVPLLLINQRECPVRHAVDNIERSQVPGPIDGLFGVLEGTPPPEGGFIVVMADMARDKVMIEWFKRMKKVPPVTGIPDIKFHNPVIIVIRMGEIEIQNRKMDMIKQGLLLKPRVGKAREQLALNNDMTPFVPAGYLVCIRRPCIENEPDIRRPGIIQVQELFELGLDLFIPDMGHP